MGDMSDRDQALKVAKLLVEKSKPDEAVAILAAWAANGPNDEKGQSSAGRGSPARPREPRSPRWRSSAWKGYRATTASSNGPIAQFDGKALAELERQHRRPVFHRAQLGFNNNVQYSGATYHVQTEDSGIDRAAHHHASLCRRRHASSKATSAHTRSELERARRRRLRARLMKAQHMEMCIALREGRFDEVIAGRKIGGMSVLEGLPAGAGAPRRGRSGRARKQSVPRSRRQGAERKVRVSAGTVRSLWGGPDNTSRAATTSSSARTATSRSRENASSAPRRRSCHTGTASSLSSISREAMASSCAHAARRARLWRRVPRRRSGALRSRQSRPPDDGPGPGPTYFYASPRWPSSFRLVQIWEGGHTAPRASRAAPRSQIGRNAGDMTFASDPLVSEHHCIIEEQAGAIVLTDLGSRAGTFVRVTGEREVLMATSSQSADPTSGRATSARPVYSVESEPVASRGSNRWRPDVRSFRNYFTQ